MLERVRFHKHSNNPNWVHIHIEKRLPHRLAESAGKTNDQIITGDGDAQQRGKDEN